MMPNLHFKTFFKSFLFTLFLGFCISETYAQSNKFTVVIDAGHGGHDPGAIGSFSREKDINLAVSIRLADLIQKNFPDVKVVLTRKTDIFLPLQERADIVNNNNANLFICVHTNSSQSASAYGAETFTLGLAKSQSNLDVAMRENSVILLEKDYKTRYKGFDPNSVDSYIMFEFMQDKYIDKSIEIAQDIQKQFANYCKRSDRGVRQAGFWVLHRSACPSVLVELGFISNPSEEKYLASDYGRQEVATGIYNAFVRFKKEFDKKSGNYSSSNKYDEITAKPQESKVAYVESGTENNDTIVQNKTATVIIPETTLISNAFNKINSAPTVSSESKNIQPVFKVQIIASEVKLKSSAAEFRGIKNIDFYLENNMYKYTVGAETDYSKILAVRKDIINKFPEAFIIAFIGEKKVSASAALKMIKK